MTRKELLDRIRSAVAAIYSPEEARAVAFEVAWRLCGVSRLQAITEPGAEVHGVDMEALEKACTLLSGEMPPQYVTGVTEFCGLELSVGEGVLVPRPETEELVRWVMQEWVGYSGARILDVGTGSGAIAVALSLLLDRPIVDAVDVSAKALDVARANAVRHGAAVSFVLADALHGMERALPRESYDVVVSNPPYVPWSEYDTMHDNVRLYEPALALFVPDEEPLRFYRAIGDTAMGLLASGGRLYFEVHETYAGDVCRMLADMGFADVEQRDDINGKPRMVRCVKE